MTEKRFIRNEIGCIVDLESNNLTYDGQEVVYLLNRLSDENKKLKKQIEKFAKEIYDIDEEVLDFVYEKGIMID